MITFSLEQKLHEERIFTAAIENMFTPIMRKLSNGTVQCKSITRKNRVHPPVFEKCNPIDAYEEPNPENYKMPTKIGQFKSGWSKMRTIFVFLLIVGVALSAPAYRNRLRYHVNAQPRMEKRSETEKESMIHFKETGRIDTESAKRELTSMPQDNYNLYGSHKHNHPTWSKEGQSRYENRHGIRYEKRMDKLREVSQEIKHEPYWVKEPYYGKYDKGSENEDEFKRNDLYKQYEMYADKFNNKYGSNDFDNDYGYGSGDYFYDSENNYGSNDHEYGYGHEDYGHNDKYDNTYNNQYAHQDRYDDNYGRARHHTHDRYDDNYGRTRHHAHDKYDDSDYRFGYDKYRRQRENKYDDYYGSDRYDDTYNNYGYNTYGDQSSYSNNYDDNYGYSQHNDYDNYNDQYGRRDNYDVYGSDNYGSYAQSGYDDTYGNNYSSY